MNTSIENAFQIYEAAFDPACDFEPNKDNFAETVEHVEMYAANALDTHIEKDVAEKIAKAYFDYQAATWGENGNGEYSHNFYSIVEEPLESIHLLDIDDAVKLSIQIED